MSKSYIWSGLFALAIVGWFASGYVIPATGIGEDEDGLAAARPQPEESKPFKVATRTFEAVTRQNRYPVRGLTEAARQVDVRARTQGTVQSQALDAGDAVQAGDVLCQLDRGARDAQLARAKAQLASARRDYEAAAELAKNNFAAKAKVASEMARMELAEAELDQIRLDMSWTTIKAPVTGVLAGKPAQTGALLEAGNPCATIKVMDPILVTAQVPERLLPNISEGMQAQAKLITGEVLGGNITHIARSSDRETRTFRVELEVDNEGYRIREGITAELYVDLPDTLAHKIPASALTLDDRGRFGARIVEPGNIVRFMPLRVLSQETDGAWVLGLPKVAQVIVTGQEFVTDGQVVETEPQDKHAQVQQ